MSSMRPITALFGAAYAPPAVSNAQSAPANSNNLLGVFMTISSRFDPESMPRPARPRRPHHIACRGAARQDAPTLGLSNESPYNAAMRKASRQKRAALAEVVFERLSAVEPAPKGELDYLNPFT